jgi:hypothetical protein
MWEGYYLQRAGYAINTGALKRSRDRTGADQRRVVPVNGRGDRRGACDPRKVMALSVQVDISIGELIDKLTILEIKRERILDQDKQSNVDLEYTKLRATFDEQIELSEALQGLQDELREVNLRLWDIEDDIRDCERRKDFGASFVALARSVYLTNDRRAEIKRAINALLGSALVEEKSYRTY